MLRLLFRSVIMIVSCKISLSGNALGRTFQLECSIHKLLHGQTAIAILKLRHVPSHGSTQRDMRTGALCGIQNEEQL